ncbi:MAG: Holliday junction resolvase RuvX, partial [Dehalococcoidia bacterium]
GTSAQTEEAREFAADLRASVPVPVHMHDERFTTREAARGRPRRGRRDGGLDSRAAAVMLQAVIDGERTP